MKKENKNIERLFQEKFKDFEVSPPDFVWENIQEKLHPKEKKRRVIPFWFKTAGIAASFVAIMSVVFFNTDNDIKNTNKNTVVSSETNKNNTTKNQNNGTKISNSSESNLKQNTANSSLTIASEQNSASNSVVNNTTTNKVPNSKLNNGSLRNSNAYESNNNFVSNNKKQTHSKRTKKNQSSFDASNSGIASNTNGRSANKKKSNSKSNPEFIDFNTFKNNNSNSQVTDLNTFNTFNSSKNKNSNSEITDINSFNSSNPTSKNNTNNDGVLVENGLENSVNTSSAIVAIEEQKIDTITLAAVIIEENLMEKLLREKETKKVADEKEKWSKWAVNSFVSPIFFNSFASGSPISDEFASNEKTFNNSTSYGVGVAYNVNKRLSIKTGVSNLNLDYDTENIAFYTTFEDQSRISNTNIERNTNGKFLVLKHEKDVSKNVIENQVLQSSQNLGNLNQRTQYIEVPLELSYAILNKKIGLAIRGGMSTLFLTENEISIRAADGNMQIGKASNLNNVHFSSNVGLGLSYNFMKNFQLNVEPTLKYQINTFNKNSEDFTPYVIGVNTGISYKF